MTHDEFWTLYDSKEIDCKIYQGKVDNGPDANQTVKTVEAFEHQGKFFLRLHTSFDYTTGRRSNGKRYKMNRGWDAIKEFDNKHQANSYFKKFFSDCEYQLVQL